MSPPSENGRLQSSSQSHLQTKTIVRPSPSLFWLLSALGVWGLWGLAYFNGMFDRLDTMMQTRTLPDGRPLRDTYSSNAFLDERLTLLSGFYDILTNALSSGPRLLFFDINLVVSCTNLWVLIESRRRGLGGWLLRYPFWIMILWNANGTAIFQPLYFYFISKRASLTHDPTIPSCDALAILLLTLPIMACPLLLFAPAWLGYSTWTHHGLIALFHTTPILLSALFALTAALLSPYYSTSKNKNPNAEKRYIVAALSIAGTVAATAHIYTVLGALKTSDPDASLRRVFVPSHGRANPFPGWIPTVDSSARGLPREYTALLEAFHLFSQWDWIVVCLSCMLYVQLLLSKHDDAENGKRGKSVEWRAVVYLVWSTVLLGPGAAGSFALAVRESGIWEEAEKVDRLRRSK